MVTRRRFLGMATGAAALGAVRRRGALAGSDWWSAEPSAPALPGDPSASGIDHVVVVMMENRSFDHFLGWLPGADGQQDTVTPRYPDASGVLLANHHLTDPMSCGSPGPDHSYRGGRFQLHDGALDNFARGVNDAYAVGFYGEADRPFMAALARHYTTCDRYFCSFLGPTTPNRLFLHCGRTDRLDNLAVPTVLPTIWDQLNHPGGPTGRYYFSDLPVLGLWGTRYLPISGHLSEFLATAAGGALPNVSYVDPRFRDARSGTSGDDHPHAHIGAGDAFLAEVFHALAAGPAWERTVLIVTYDEWGGFYDHVAPPRVTPGLALGDTPEAGVDRDLVDGRVLLGFRVPAIVASPFTRGSDPNAPRISHLTFDHTSILRLIQWRFGLAPLGARDASTRPGDPGNLAAVLQPHGDASVPADIPFPAPPVVVPCPPDSPDPGAFNPPVGRTPADAGPADPDDDMWPAFEAAGMFDGWGLG